VSSSPQALAGRGFEHLTVSRSGKVFKKVRIKKHLQINGLSEFDITSPDSPEHTQADQEQTSEKHAESYVFIGVYRYR
jgi:hypothetical protein